VPSIAANNDATVSFVANVTAAPSGGATDYVNTVTAGYTFQSPDSTPLTGSVTANNTVYLASDLIVPTVTKSDTSSNPIAHVATIGDTIDYTITIQNTNATKSITNVVLRDTIPSGLTFNPNSLDVNGSSTPGSSLPASISLGTINPSSSATVKFSVTVANNPASNSKYINTAEVDYNFQTTSGTNLSNTVTNTNTVYSEDVVITPTVSKSDTTSNTIPHIVAINDTVTYTITIHNPDTTKPITNINLTDTLPSGLTFKAGSVSINGTPNASANPTTGISISSIASSSDATVSFVANVTAAPSGGASKYVNAVTAQYSFESPDSTTLTNTVTTNNTIYPDSVVITPTITKSDTTSNTIPHIVAINDTVTYTITI
ncbi:DUF11 domain-containing protein, partial [Clostridium botulinum C]|uniref:isopeptide-forming domain-containing fimbrial protein n=1 Tax=Clostridium botulinum TaxID=1491 RepID=UPI001E2DE9BB